MFLAQARTTVGLHPSVVVDLDRSRAVAYLARVGWPAEQIVTLTTAGEAADVASRGGIGVTDNVAAAIDSGIDVLVESTGNVSAAAHHAAAAFEAGVHVVQVDRDRKGHGAGEHAGELGTHLVGLLASYG